VNDPRRNASWSCSKTLREEAIAATSEDKNEQSEGDRSPDIG
jgi:hypothetical protein